MTEQTISWKEKIQTKFIDDVVQGIDFLDNISRTVNGVTTVVKNIASKDPRALDNNIASYYIENTFGKPALNTVIKIYHNIIDYNR
jgi:hypothetical protein